MSKAALASLLVVAAVVMGYWLGEHRFSPLPFWQLLPLFALAAFSFYLLRQSGLATSAFVSGCCVVTTAFTWGIGSRSATASFNECVTSGERIRVQLAAYQQQHGQYPAHLGQLHSNLPCQLVLPPQFLSYSATESGYVLSFSDAFVTHKATNTEAFIASK